MSYRDERCVAASSTGTGRSNPGVHGGDGLNGRELGSRACSVMNALASAGYRRRPDAVDVEGDDVMARRKTSDGGAAAEPVDKHALRDE